MKQSIQQQYKATLHYLYTQLPMFQKVGGAAFKKDLSNIIRLCNHLGHNYQHFPSIHIAGTNGKGSTTHLIGAMLQASELKVGYYTSPHYKDFRERIKINGQLMSKRYVVDFVKKHSAIFEKVRPSFFEITVAMAFDYFAQEKVDVAVIETGLGGRLDSTNIITPLLSVITNISYDHQQFLGDTLPQIASEKAGIIKPNIPVVIGETQKATKAVFETTAQKNNAPITFADKNISVIEKAIQAHHTVYYVKGRPHNFNHLAVNLMGNYQQKNITTALQAIATINKNALLPTITPSAIQAGLKNLKALTYFLGRWQQLSEIPTIICDSGHNQAGIQQILQQLEKMPYEQLHFVLGMVNDKAIDKILKMLPTNARYYFVKADIPRGLDANKLKAKAAIYGLKGRKYSSVKNGLKAAKRNAEKKDLIFVGGSTFVVAEVV
ncbi:MAG: folylpolyglutamate synthase/dihydrofolate synthase family protein [Saprospiraceae bacterium]